jgi:hypothetical protein
VPVDEPGARGAEGTVAVVEKYRAVGVESLASVSHCDQSAEQAAPHLVG